MLGSIASGQLIAKRHGVDLRAVGSKNIGATNAARALGFSVGALTVAADSAKGLLAYLIASFITESLWFQGLAALTVVAGHCFSFPPSRSRGGKGVATSFGAFLGLSPLSALGALAVFVVIVWKTRIVSAASVAAALLCPLIALLLDVEFPHLVGMCSAALLVVARHRENLLRLSAGKEPAWERESLSSGGERSDQQ